jgi:hypothetical protein
VRPVSPPRRITPALISGKVVPSRIDCGRTRSAASVHFTACTANGPGSDGSSRSYAQPVEATYASWKTMAMSPTASSAAAYHSSGLRTRSAHRPTARAPSDIPPRKMTRTMICAYALCPTKSPRYRLQIASYIRPAAPESVKAR